MRAMVPPPLTPCEAFSFFLWIRCQPLMNGRMRMGQDEVVYHVDAKDREIGRILRSEAHLDACFHRAAHVWLLTGAGRLILQQRSRDKAVAPGRWTSTASGHVKYGSTYDETAAEELWEEAGLRGVPLRPLGRRVLVGFSDDGREVCRGWPAVYAGRCPVDVAELRPQAGEVTRFQAFSLDDVAAALRGEAALRDDDGAPVLFSTTFASAMSTYAEDLRSVRD